jgi:hypothetical protein
LTALASVLQQWIMPDKKRPRDPSQLAYQIMLKSMGQAEKLEPRQRS